MHVNRDLQFNENMRFSEVVICKDSFNKMESLFVSMHSILFQKQSCNCNRTCVLAQQQTYAQEWESFVVSLKARLNLFLEQAKLPSVV